MIRYGITHRNGFLRGLTFRNIAINLYDTREEAEKAMKLFEPDLRSKILGDKADTLRVMEFDCYDHGEAKSIYTQNPSTTDLDEPKRAVLASKVYDILSELSKPSTDPYAQFDFVHNFSKMLLEGQGEYRFGMGLGFGGKAWVNDDGTRIYVNQYREDETKESQKIVEAVNEKLAALLIEFIRE